jgi:hypothetical protein
VSSPSLFKRLPPPGIYTNRPKHGQMPNWIKNLLLQGLRLRGYSGPTLQSHARTFKHKCASVSFPEIGTRVPAASFGCCVAYKWCRGRVVGGLFQKCCCKSRGSNGCPSSEAREKENTGTEGNAAPYTRQKPAAEEARTAGKQGSRQRKAA